MLATDFRSKETGLPNSRFFLVLPTIGRINLVYTPPEYRRKGYATACVTALSQKLLDQGCRNCFLMADLANPTANHIYQGIGYRPICDWHEYSFTSKK
jgi:uncharacterized protein